ncbi:aldehyde dehydrogenase family protein [Brevundimonas sp.]|uniref:aldehyde dehydrogenase family protein n=1 Tax=Brevundimonas sp. TaxID=1871086 RepID=UPI002606D242|nr:aldehyde dehydrogenase family protein [Brevundimonas sp.]
MTSLQPDIRFPSRAGLPFGGSWVNPVAGSIVTSVNPANGRPLATFAEAGAGDVDAVVAAAKAGFSAWRRSSPPERAAALRQMAGVLRDNAEELAILEAADCGNPVRNARIDVLIAAASLEFFAGLVTEAKGDTIPVGPDALNFTRREPRGVVARIVAFNHPLMFVALKAAAPLAVGNSVIIKPAEQAPLSALRFAELIDGILPPGVFNIVPGDRAFGAGLVSHPGVAMVGLVGSIATGKAVLRGAAETIKPVVLELGGKNALIACADADPEVVARAMITGMNFNWCGQSCGSTSRAFLHASIHDDVVERLVGEVASFVPGNPLDPATTMGSLISRAHYDRVLDYIGSGEAEGARMLVGGPVEGDASLAEGAFVSPTIFVDVTSAMRIAREEIFGPVLSVLKWSDEDAMLEEVNALEYGLTCSIWTRDISAAHRLSHEVEAGQVWINDVGKHITGAPFGGYKQSGLGREGGIEELYACTQEKNVYVNLT